MKPKRHTINPSPARYAKMLEVHAWLVNNPDSSSEEVAKGNGYGMIKQVQPLLRDMREMGLVTKTVRRVLVKYDFQPPAKQRRCFWSAKGE